MMRRWMAIAGLACLGAAGCETYEFPPRLEGVGTEDCPECRVLALSESRLPPGSTTISARFAFDDERAAIGALRIFVTTPSGTVVEESYDVEVEEEREVPGDTDAEPTTQVVEVTETRFRPGFTCTFSLADDEEVGDAVCLVTSTRSTPVVSTDVGVRLEGYNQGVLTATFGVIFDEIGEWTVEVEAERIGGVRSNRLAATIDVVEDVGEDPDEGNTDTN